jgi:hypothetical protein
MTSSVAKSPRFNRTHLPLISQMEGMISNMVVEKDGKGVKNLTQ